MMEFRNLKIEEMDEWADHCMYVFNGGTYLQSFRQYFINHYYNDPWRDLKSILVAVEDGKIVSTVRIFHRKIYIKGEIIEMGGIGEVSTNPNYRSKGLSSKLITLAIKRMQELGISVSMLGAATERIGFYHSFGWESLSRCFNKSIVKGNNDGEFKVRRVNFETDIMQISSIFRAYSGNHNGIVVRDECYWDKWVKTEVKNFYVLEDDNNTIIGYIDADKQGKAIKIREFGQLLDQENIFPLLVSKIVYLLGQDECEVIYPTAIQSTIKVDVVIEEINEMVRLINPFELGGTQVKNTQELVKILNNCSEGEKSESFISWDTDGF